MFLKFEKRATLLISTPNTFTLQFPINNNPLAVNEEIRRENPSESTEWQGAIPRKQSSFLWVLTHTYRVLCESYQIYGTFNDNIHAVRVFAT